MSSLPFYLFSKVFQDESNWSNSKSNRNGFIDCEIEVQRCQDRRSQNKSMDQKGQELGNFSYSHYYSVKTC